MTTFEKLRKKHPELPEFKTLDEEFDISTLEKPTLKELTKKVQENIEYYLNFLNGILQPDTNSLAAMIECDAFTETQKKEIVKLFEQTMYIYRLLLETDLKRNEKTYAQTIKQTTEEWSKLRKKILPFVTKLKNHWKNPSEIKEILEYLG